MTRYGVSASPAHIIAGAGPRPILTEDGVHNGEVTLGFLKKGFTGVQIRTKRGGGGGTETEYSFLARDTEAPYVDTRANLRRTLKRQLRTGVIRSSCC